MGTAATPRSHKESKGSAKRHGRRVARLLWMLAKQSPGSDTSTSAEIADLPWLDQLEGQHLKTFLEEYSSAYERSIDTGEWQALDDLLGEWQATAEALADPELRRLVTEEGLPEHDRVELEFPH